MTVDGHLRANLDDGVELDVALLLPGGDVDLGRRDDVDVLGLDRFGVVATQRVAQRLVARDLGPHPSLEQPTRGLARAEAGHLHLTGELAERGVDRGLEVGRGNGDVESDLVPFESLDGRRHGHGAEHSSGRVSDHLARARGTRRGDERAERAEALASERTAAARVSRAAVSERGFRRLPWSVVTPPGAWGCTGSW